MSPDHVFSFANALALAAWLGLLLLPHVAVIRNVIAAAVIPCLFAAAYAVILARFFDPGGFAKFGALEGLASLQGSPWLLLAGWLHYLAFDLFVGAWEVRTARTDRWIRKQRRTFTANHLVLAAGTYGTQRLLFE